MVDRNHTLGLSKTTADGCTALRADLHIHTSFSDGLFPPERVIDRVVKANLNYFAITDHDTMGAYPRARDYLSSLDISNTPTLIPGLEISTKMDGRDIHMLGYYVENMCPELIDELDRAEKSRKTRSIAIVGKLEDAGYPISCKEFEGGKATLNRTTIARILQDAGAIPSVEYAYDNLIGEGCPYYVDRQDIPTPRAIQLICMSGGLPVMAHPALYHVVDLIEPCMEYGLRGVEAFHGDHTPEQAASLAALGDRLGLIVTGGSDWHGDPLHTCDIGHIDIPGHYLEEFLAADPR